MKDNKEKYIKLINDTGYSILSFILLLISFVYLLPLLNFESYRNSISIVFFICVLKSYFLYRPVKFIYDFIVYSLICILLIYLL